MAAAAEGGGVTFGTIEAVDVGSGVGTAVAVGSGEAGVTLGDGPPALGEAVGVARRRATGSGRRRGGRGDRRGGRYRAGVGVTAGVGVGPLPVLITYMIRPVPPAPWPNTTIWPDVGDWWTLFGLTDKVATLLASGPMWVQPVVWSGGQSPLTAACRRTIEPSESVLTHETSDWVTGIWVGTRFGVADAPSATPCDGTGRLSAGRADEGVADEEPDDHQGGDRAEGADRRPPAARE